MLAGVAVTGAAIMIPSTVYAAAGDMRPFQVHVLQLLASEKRNRTNGLGVIRIS
jgi:hypothetical protein